MPNHTPHHKCLACNSFVQLKEQGRMKSLTNKDYHLYKCDDCGSGWAFPRPSNEELNDFYSNYNGLNKSNISISGTREQLIESNKAIIEDCMERLQFTQKKVNLLNKDIVYTDIGCGYGYSVLAGEKLGFKSNGIDLDPSAINIGSRVLQLNLKHGDINSNLEKDSNLNLITMWQVLEHIENYEETIKIIHQSLHNKNGYFAGTVPNYGGIYSKIKKLKWYSLCPPEHINFFTKKSLEIIFERNGFEVVWIGSTFKSCAPLISFGIRAKIETLKNDSRMPPILAKVIRRALTLTKRHLIYLPINFIIYTFRLGGNSIFFIVKKDCEQNSRVSINI